MHGGGFGGVTMNVVRKEDTDAFLTHMEVLVGRENLFVTPVRTIGATEIIL